MQRSNFGVLMIMMGAALHTQTGLIVAAAMVAVGYFLTTTPATYVAVRS